MHTLSHTLIHSLFPSLSHTRTYHVLNCGSRSIHIHMFCSVVFYICIFVCLRICASPCETLLHGWPSGRCGCSHSWRDDSFVFNVINTHACSTRILRHDCNNNFMASVDIFYSCIAICTQSINQSSTSHSMIATLDGFGSLEITTAQHGSISWIGPSNASSSFSVSGTGLPCRDN